MNGLRNLSLMEFLGWAILCGIVGILLTLGVSVVWMQDKSIAKAARIVYTQGDNAPEKVEQFVIQGDYGAAKNTIDAGAVETGDIFFRRSSAKAQWGMGPAR